ncbi:MAG: VTT domain-containing protein [Gemmatimonadota bacterium]|nr:VTT domain-containing protein [Gemmatimonadota bacterium]MDH3428183.1 VTT domain-containing protein [Gemmatimonadota bacterium]
MWDILLRVSAALALLGILLTRVIPEIGGLVSFVVVTIWVNGPLAPFLPATYEPILMLFGRLYPPLLIAALGIAGTLFIEFINYYMYQKLVNLGGTRRLRDTKVVQRVVKLFERAPFFTVWLCSWSLLPYWAIRVVAPMAGYPIRRYLAATFLGRFPRLWFFAALGQFLDVSVGVLAAITAGAILLGLVVFGRRRRESSELKV